MIEFRRKTEVFIGDGIDISRQLGFNQPCTDEISPDQDRKFQTKDFPPSYCFQIKRMRLLKLALVRVCAFEVSPNREGVRYQIRKTELEWGVLFTMSETFSLYFDSYCT